MPTRKFSALIVETAGLSALNRATQRISALQRLYTACSPPELAQASRVVGDHDGVLVVAADNGAIAAKLKQLAPRLLKNLQKLSAQITGIRVQIQVKQAEQATPPPRLMRPKKSLPVDLIDDFERLAHQVKDPGLRSALSRFAARRRSGS
jgi:hypothetical protein